MVTEQGPHPGSYELGPRAPQEPERRAVALEDLPHPIDGEHAVRRFIDERLEQASPRAGDRAHEPGTHDATEPHEKRQGPLRRRAADIVHQ